MKRLIVTADDFGLAEPVNEAVERAHRDGILTAASLMVAGPAAADAVRRAKAMRSLAVGLHLVVIEGPAILPPHPFPSGQFRLGVDYFFRPAARRRLAAEIRAQFAAFAATGLRLDHANAHKHMHLHPTVGRMLIDIGREFGLGAVRVPTEPGLDRRGERARWADATLRAWTRLLRRQVRRAGMLANDHCFGLRWTGAMTTERVRRLLERLPPGLSEIYFHPATRTDEQLAALMPGYDHRGELAALLDPEVRAIMAANGVRLLAGFGVQNGEPTPAPSGTARSD